MKNITKLIALIIMAITFFSFKNDNPKILINTELGEIVVELFINEAPISSKNFLKYVDNDKFKEGTFYRIVTMDNQPNNDVKIEVIQGGRTRGDTISFPAIEHETTDATGILHTNGVISMARNDPGTATSEFFICVGEQPELDFGGKRNSDGQGFAAFGKVIKGMDVVHNIHQLPVEGQYLDPRIKIINITRMK